MAGEGAVVAMRDSIRCTALVLLLSLFVQLHARAETACVDAISLAHSTVSITRYFDDAERTAQPDLAGVQGTGWFQSPTTIVTVEHVAVAMGLSTQDWKLLDIKDSADSYSIAVRIQRLAGDRMEKLAVLELQTAISTARSVAIRMSPLEPDDRVVTLAYPQHHLRFVAGRFVQYVDEGRLAGAALLEMHDGNNRLVIDHGASGAPVFDCEGRIAAVISTVITQILQTPFGEKRISTAWGTPNVVSVPVHQRMEFTEAK
jgi:hypothetical protein